MLVISLENEGAPPNQKITENSGPGYPNISRVEGAAGQVFAAVHDPQEGRPGRTSPGGPLRAPSTSLPMPPSGRPEAPAWHLPQSRRRPPTRWAAASRAPAPSPSSPRARQPPPPAARRARAPDPSHSCRAGRREREAPAAAGLRLGLALLPPRPREGSGPPLPTTAAPPPLRRGPDAPPRRRPRARLARRRRSLPLPPDPGRGRPRPTPGSPFVGLGRLAPPPSPAPGAPGGGARADTGPPCCLRTVAGDGEEGSVGQGLDSGTRRGLKRVRRGWRAPEGRL